MSTWLEPSARAALRALVRSEALRAPPPEAEALLAALRERYGDAVLGAIFYGSCRREGVRSDSVLDLHVVLRSLRPALAPLAALACAVLPPNVAYLELGEGPERLRGKVALLSLAQLRRGCSRRAFMPYFWGRYAQSVTLVGFEDPEPIIDDLVEALATFAWRTLPLLDAHASGDDPALDYWREALRASYGSELRPEGAERAAALVASDAEHYRRTGSILRAQREWVRRSESATRRAWWLRRALGKGVTVLRLVKAAWTFEGGVDYALSKLERHGAAPIVVSERVRRWPLVFGWPLLWRLWRGGSLR